MAFALCFSLFSCEKSISCYEFLTEFSAEYPLDGVIYHSSAEEYEDSYLSEELFRTVYIYSGDIPSDFALFLNSRPSRGEECGIFKARDARERRELISMCYERCGLVSERGSEYLVLTSGDFVFYSTLSDNERAKNIFESIIK